MSRPPWSAVGPSQPRPVEDTARVADGPPSCSRRAGENRGARVQRPRAGVAPSGGRNAPEVHLDSRADQPNAPVVSVAIDRPVDPRQRRAKVTLLLADEADLEV